MKKLAIFLIALINLQFADAQSQYMPSGQGGFMASGSFKSTSKVRSYGAQIGSSMAGVIDIGASIRTSYINQFTGHSDVKELALAPFMNIFWLKQRRGYSPISIFTGINYELNWISSAPISTTQALSATEKKWRASAGITHSIDLTYATSIMPTISINYGQGLLDYKSINAKGFEMLMKSNQEALIGIQIQEYGGSIALPLLINNASGKSFLIEPSYYHSNLNQQITLKLGIILSQGKARCKGGMCPVFR